MSETYIFLVYVDRFFAIRAVMKGVQKCSCDANSMKILMREATFQKRVVVTMTCNNAVVDDKSNAKIRIPFPKKDHRFSQVIRFEEFAEKKKN